MSNALTTSNMPQHLQALVGNQALQSMNQDAVKGISSGAWPRISLKGSRFRLQDPQGQEYIVPRHWLDVVLVAVNPHGLSKIYYEGAYDPGSEGGTPACYSDNGVAPSFRAAKPQCGTCAACPHNAWGSKITPSGTQVKACADVKKVAVLLADNTSGPVFELRIPGASLSNFAAYVRGMDAAGVPAASIVTRLQFDTSADYPKLLFAAPEVNGDHPMPWQNYPYITAEMLGDVLDVVNGEEVKLCTGANDKPREASVGVSATSLIAQQNALLTLPPMARVVPASPLPPAPHVSGPALPSGAVGPTPPPNPAFPHAGAPAEAPAKRARRKAVDAVQAAAPAVPPPVAPPSDTPAFLNRARTAVPPNLQPIPQNARDVSAPVSVEVTDARLDDLLAQAMKS